MFHEQLLDPAFSRQLCLVLFHSLWQVTLLAVLARLLSSVPRNRSATRAYAIHTSAMLLSLAALPVTWFLVGSDPVIPVSSPQASTAAQMSMSEPRATETIQSPMTSAQIPSTPVSETTPSGSIAEQTDIAADPTPSAGVPTRVTPWLAACYLAGVVLMLARLMISVLRWNQLGRGEPLNDGPLVAKLRQLSREWSLKVRPRIVQTQRTVVPQVVGLLRPVILLPASAVNGLSSDQLELILIHELAHIRRHDMWVYLVQRVGETLLFFNPALWYLNRRINILREFCCDDITCGTVTAPDPQLRYATALLRVVELASPKTADLTALAAAASSPSELRRRILRLFGESLSEPLRLSRSGLLTFLVVAGLTVLAPVFQSHDSASDASVAAADDAAPQVDSDELQVGDSERVFRLLVVGPDNRPVPEASVALRGEGQVESNQIHRGSFEKHGRYGTATRTDKQGQLTIVIPKARTSLRVSIKKPGYGPFWSGWESDTHPQQIPDRFTAQLDKGWSIGGIVVDGDGRPIAGAEVRPNTEFKKRPGDNRQLGTGEVIRTDDHGQWRYDMVPESTPTPHISINHPDYKPLRVSMSRDEYELTPDGTPNKTITLNTGLRITGRVTDPDGRPIEGALVRTKFMNDLRKATTDSAGRYQLVGCEPLMTRVVVSAKTWATDMQEVHVDPDMKPVDFQMQPGGHLRVRVVDESGRGLKRARIFLQRWRGHVDYFEFDHVDEYTDENGVWEWNEAPLDEFNADICRPDGMQIRYQPLKAREREYVFTPPKALVISGRVVDAETKEPISRFRVVPGTFNEPAQRQGDHWDESEAYEATDGRYRMTRGIVAPAHRIRIEAEGYRIQTSRDIRSDEGNVDISFELRPAEDIIVRLVTPAGTPAVDAHVALGIKSSQIAIVNGECHSRSTYADLLTSDEQGQLKIPERNDPFELIVTHPDGFARVLSEEGDIPETVTLTAWARIEGVYRSGDEPVAGQSVSLNSQGPGPADGRLSHGYRQYEFDTDDSGHFVIERVFPGYGYVGRRFVSLVGQGITTPISSKQIYAEFAPGSTTQVNIGGDGRHVTGTLAPPQDHQGPVLWNFARIYVEVDSGEDERQWPTPPEDIAQDTAALNQWWFNWQQSEEGQGMIRRSRELRERQKRQTRYRASVDRDGSFAIDDISAGEYVLRVDFSRDAPGTLTSYQFTVPELQDGDVGRELSLGQLNLDRLKTE